MSKVHDPDQELVYLVERIAFDFGALNDHLRESSLIAETEQVLDSLWWKHQSLPQVDVRGARVDMVTWGGYAKGAKVRYSAGGSHRYIVSHELAHVVAYHHGICDHHGSNFRAVHVRLVGAIYGAEYAHDLASSYSDAGIPADMFVLTGLVNPTPATPIIPIDDLMGSARGGWAPPTLTGGK